MSGIENQLHEIAYAIGKLAGAICLLAVTIGVSDFDGKVARAIEQLASAMKR